ncbi:MAG: pseudouridine synthase [Pseudomonadota bacterium]
MLVAFNKPMNVLSQFTSEGGWPGLSRFDLPKSIYAAGRLDRDSEGLLLLTDDGRLKARITAPKMRTKKVYLALVEGIPSTPDLAQLQTGLDLRDGPARAASAEIVPAPDWLWPRDPPVRLRKSITDTWLSITLTEGRNRQVRRMCAAIGFPVLRLVRIRIGAYGLQDLAPGTWREIADR